MYSTIERLILKFPDYFVKNFQGKQIFIRTPVHEFLDNFPEEYHFEFSSILTNKDYIANKFDFNNYMWAYGCGDLTSMRFVGYKCKVSYYSSFLSSAIEVNYDNPEIFRECPELYLDYLSGTPVPAFIKMVFDEKLDFKKERQRNPDILIKYN